MTIKINTTILQLNTDNHEHQKYFWNTIALQEKSQSGMRKLNRKQEHSVCGFVASSLVLMFAVIDHNTINIPEIFQVQCKNDLWHVCSMKSLSFKK